MSKKYGVTIDLYGLSYYPCLHAFWHSIPTSLSIIMVFNTASVPFTCLRILMTLCCHLAGFVGKWSGDRADAYWINIRHFQVLSGTFVLCKLPIPICDNCSIAFSLLLRLHKACINQFVLRQKKHQRAVCIVVFRCCPQI